MRTFEKVRVIVAMVALSVASVLTFSSSANAVTVFSHTPATGMCIGGAGTCDAAFLVSDLDIFAFESYIADTTTAFITRTLEFKNTGLAGLVQTTTQTDAADFNMLTFTWSGAGLGGPLVIDALSVASQSFLMAANSTYTLVVTGQRSFLPNDNFAQWDVGLSAIPIPPALLLFGSGLFGLGLLSRRKQQRKATMVSV